MKSISKTARDQCSEIFIFISVLRITFLRLQAWHHLLRGILAQVYWQTISHFTLFHEVSQQYLTNGLNFDLSMQSSDCAGHLINVPQVHIITDIITPTDTKRTALECQDSKYKTTTYGIRTFPLAIVTMFIVMFIIFHHTRISSCQGYFEISPASRIITEMY